MDFQSTFNRNIQPPKHYQMKNMDAHRCKSIEARIVFDYLKDKQEMSPSFQS